MLRSGCSRHQINLQFAHSKNFVKIASTRSWPVGGHLLHPLLKKKSRGGPTPVLVCSCFVAKRSSVTGVFPNPNQNKLLVFHLNCTLSLFSRLTLKTILIVISMVTIFWHESAAYLSIFSAGILHVES